MAIRGRPRLGARIVDTLDGPEQSKQRLRVALETLSGERTIEQATKELRIGESRFHDIRRRALEAALVALAPGPVGRPPCRPPPTSADEVAELRARVKTLEAELLVTELRADVLAAATGPSAPIAEARPAAPLKKKLTSRVPGREAKRRPSQKRPSQKRRQRR